MGFMGVYFHGVLGQFHPCCRRAFRGPGPWGTCHPACRCGPCGALSRAGAGGLPAWPLWVGAGEAGCLGACRLWLRRLGRGHGPTWLQLWRCCLAFLLWGIRAPGGGCRLLNRARRGVGGEGGGGPASKSRTASFVARCRLLGGRPDLCRRHTRQLANGIGYEAPDVCLREGGPIQARGGGGGA